MNHLNVKAALVCVVLISCSVDETVTLPAPQSNSNGEQSTIVTIGQLIINVLDQQGQPVEGAIIGSIPTLNAVVTVAATPADQKTRLLATERFISNELGQYIFTDKTFNVLQSPMFFNAYVVDQAHQSVLFGTTFVDLETSQDTINVTIVVEAKAVRNPTVRIALFDPEPFPRAVDFLSREGIVFDNLLYHDYYRDGGHDWSQWTEPTWADILSEQNLSQYDVFIVGFDASKYAEFDRLVAYKQALVGFVKNHSDKLLFLAQQNHTSFNWSWVADFDVPQEGENGGFLTTAYETAHLEDGLLTEKGSNHPIFRNTPLTDLSDINNNSVADIWENWRHIEPNKPQQKNQVAWHAGNSKVFSNYGWDILVAGPATEHYFDLPKAAGVVTAVKNFANGSTIFFSDATYYQASFGPQKVAAAILLKDRYVEYITTWPALRQ